MAQRQKELLNYLVPLMTNTYCVTVVLPMCVSSFWSIQLEVPYAVFLRKYFRRSCEGR